ncbi:MAG TPA: sulfatase [Planctomycetaceae bacterium]|nr:sulfatase [Planctomycetaceae bacterium]
MTRKMALLAVLVLALGLPPEPAAGSDQPNVVLFLVDDMGWMDSGAYGSRYYETPHIDRLAKRGMLFTDAYSAHPLCSPTRASILTGKYPARLGLTTAAGHLPPQPKDAPRYAERAGPNRALITPESLRYLDPAEYTLAEALQGAGYRTAHFGKWHLGLTEDYWPERQGFDVAWHGKPDPGPRSYFSPYQFRAGTITSGPPGEYITDRLTDEVLEFLDENRERPFFLNVWQFGVHGPWGHKEAYTREFAAKTDPRGAQGNPIMASMLRSVDESLGRIVARLDELGLSERTLIVFSSDNGGNVHSNVPGSRQAEAGGPRIADWRKWAGNQPPTNNAPLRDGKASLYEGGVRVPLIVVWPGVVPAGARSSAVVSTIDFYPTILDLLNLPASDAARFDGISFTRVLRDPEAQLDRQALFNFFPHGGPARPPGVSVRQGDWKLIRWFETGPEYPSRHELYNLREDLGETRNLAAAHPERVAQLDALSDGFLKDTAALLPKPNPAYDARRRARR